MSFKIGAVVLLAAALPLSLHAQDSTSGDDASPMTQRMCDKSPGSCNDMQSRHELCQKHPDDCQGTKSDSMQAHDRAAGGPAKHRHPAAAAPARRQHQHRRAHQPKPTAIKCATIAEAAGHESTCQAHH